jgi:catechol 2,3-dioxygenase-like lactoylglutathione lyase family enzyme
MDVQRYTHPGICISDLDRSVRFYRDVFGFEEIGSLDLEGAPLDKLNGLQGAKVMELRELGWVGLNARTNPQPDPPRCDDAPHRADRWGSLVQSS